MSGTGGLLRGGRSKSYGSLVRSPLSPVTQRRIEHHIQPGETLQGLALKYGVTMEQIKRVNRLYTNDSIFLKKSLSIPLVSDDTSARVPDLVEEDQDGGAPVHNGHTGSSSERNCDEDDDGQERAADLTPEDFMKRLDRLIKRSKQAAFRGRPEAEKRVAALEVACTSGTSDRRPLTRSHSVTSSPRMQQLETVAVPLTITKLTRKLRHSEDEIFEL